MGAPIVTTTKTLVLTPGECVIFPPDIIIDAVITTGAITVTSTCPGILPAASGYKCWQFVWECSDGGGCGDMTDAYMESITIGPDIYPLVDVPGTNTWNTDGDFLQNSIPISVPAGLCNVLQNCGYSLAQPVKAFALEVPEYLGMPLIKWVNPVAAGTSTGYLIPNEDVCGC